MSGTETQADPFVIKEFPKVVISPGVTVDVSITDPDLINGIITAQGSAIKAVLGEATVTASFGAVSKLGIASGVAFDVIDGIIGQQSFAQIAASAGLDAGLSYAPAAWHRP